MPQRTPDHGQPIVQDSAMTADGLPGEDSSAVAMPVVGGRRTDCPPADGSLVLEFTPEDSALYVDRKSHNSDIWRTASILSGTGAACAIGWVALYSVNLFASNSRSEDVMVAYLDRAATAVSIDVAAKLLAVMATLVVAVAVVVRGIPDSRSVSAPGIDRARRNVLSQVASCTGIISVAIATLTAITNFGASDWTIPGLATLVFIAVVIALISADAALAVGRAKVLDRKWEAWVRNTEATRLARTLPHWDNQCSGSPNRDTRIGASTHCAVIILAYGSIFAIYSVVVALGTGATNIGDLIREFLVTLLVCAVTGGAFSASAALWLYSQAFRRWGLTIFYSAISGSIAIAFIAGLAARWARPGSDTATSLWLSLFLLGLMALAVVFFSFNNKTRKCGRFVALVVPDFRGLVRSMMMKKIVSNRRRNLELHRNEPFVDVTVVRVDDPGFDTQHG